MTVRGVQNTRIKRGNTADWAEWTGQGLVLKDGEPGWDEELGVLRVGNGTDAWDDLPLAGGGSAGGGGRAGVTSSVDFPYAAPAGAQPGDLLWWVTPFPPIPFVMVDAVSTGNLNATAEGWLQCTTSPLQPSPLPPLALESDPGVIEVTTDDVTLEEGVTVAKKIVDGAPAESVAPVFQLHAAGEDVITLGVRPSTCVGIKMTGDLTPYGGPDDGSMTFLLAVPDAGHYYGVEAAGSYDLQDATSGAVTPEQVEANRAYVESQVPAGIVVEVDGVYMVITAQAGPSKWYCRWYASPVEWIVKPARAAEPQPPAAQ